MTSNPKKVKSLLFKVLSSFVIVAFLANGIFPIGKIYAQGNILLPPLGTFVSLSPSYASTIAAGITLYPENPLQFDFIIDTGDDNLQGEKLQQEAQKLISYFMATLTIPEDEMWVNLSPYEKGRISAKGLGNTILGRDMLSQDYLLKQLTASLMYPEDESGNAFWERIYKKAYDKFQTTDIPINTFHKIWIIPDKAVVYVNGANIFVADSHLRVMLEEDYLALEHHDKGLEATLEKFDLTQETKIIFKEVLLPEIEKEINEGKNFAPLRQIYHSMILATWYKKNLKESLLGEVYVNQNKVHGVALKDKETKNKIYNQYLKSFEKGVYNYIGEDYDEVSRSIVLRKYFSGGEDFAKLSDEAMLVSERINSEHWLSKRMHAKKIRVGVQAKLDGPAGDYAMIAEVTRQEKKRISHMVGLSDTSEFSDWVDLRSQWEIVEMIYSPGGIQYAGIGVEGDVFGNFPHNVYVVRNFQNGAMVYMGPDDVLYFFPEDEDKKRINALRKEKKKQQKVKVAQIKLIRQYRKWMQDVEGINLLLSDPHIDQDKVNPGDRHFPVIQEILGRYERLWQEQFQAEIDLERFAEIYKNLKSSLNILLNRKLSYLSREDQRQVVGFLQRIENGERLSEPMVKLIIEVHEKILQKKTQHHKESLGWGKGETQESDVINDPQRPAFHANIWIANYLAKVFGEGDRPMILDVGANSSVLWQILRELGITLDEGIIDLEYSEFTYNRAPNPYRILGDISKLNKQGFLEIQAASNETAEEMFSEANTFDTVVFSFVFDQLAPLQVRNALIALENLLSTPDKNPKLIITSPENSPLQNSELDRVLHELGYVAVNQESNITNKLTAEAEARILQEEGRERLSQIKASLKKVFHAAVYEKRTASDAKSISAINLERLKIRKGKDRTRKGDKIEPNQFFTTFSDDDLINMEIRSGLGVKDFATETSGEIIHRDQINRDEKYDDFLRNLVILALGHAGITEDMRLPNGLKKVLSMAYQMHQEWTDESPAFIPQADVEAINKAVYASAFTFAEIKKIFPHLENVFEKSHAVLREEKRREIEGYSGARYQAALKKFDRELETKRYALSLIFNREAEYRKAHQGKMGDGLRKALNRAVYEEYELRVERSRLKSDLRKALGLVSLRVGEQQKPRISQIALALKWDIQELWYRKVRYLYNETWEDLGIIYDKRSSADARKAAIMGIAAAYKSRGLLVSIDDVARELTLSRSGLNKWKKDNFPEETWQSWGLMLRVMVNPIERKKEIINVAKAIEKSGGVSNIISVAEEVGISAHEMNRFKHENFPNETWEAWDITPNAFTHKNQENISEKNENRKNKIIELAKKYQKENGTQINITNMAEILGLSPYTLRTWRKKYYPDEAWDHWGVSTGRQKVTITAKEKDSFLEEVQAAVLALEARGDVINKKNVAKELGIGPQAMRERKEKYLTSSDDLKHWELLWKNRETKNSKKTVGRIDGKLDEANKETEDYAMIVEGRRGSVNKKAQGDEYGGIDFNPNNLKLDQKGQYANIHFKKFAHISPGTVRSVTHIITNLTSISNFPLLLGQ